jgi:hypothetical protein
MTMFRTRVVRADGRAFNVVQRRAHLSYARRATGNPKKLAAAMRATCVRLEELDQEEAVRLIREIA